MSGQRVFRTYVNDAFKWHPHVDERARFGSVFVGSNDFGNIDAFDRIVAQLRALQEDFPLVLVSPIGGMGFLQFLGEVRFQRIWLVDDNIAEHAKAAVLLNALLSSSWDTFTGFEDLERRLAGNPAQLLPRLGDGCHQFEFGPQATYSYLERSSPTVPLLPVSRYPEFRWRPSREQFELAQENVRHAVSEVLHTRFMAVRNPSAVAVYFLSNLSGQEFPASRVRQLGKAAALALPVRSHAPNDAALLPHPIWEACVKPLLGARSLHVWAPEDRELIGSRMDQITSASCGLGTLRPQLAGDRVQYDTVLFHMQLSKCGGDTRLRERWARLALALTSVAHRARRIVVAEAASGAPEGRPPRFGIERVAAWVDAQIGGLGFRRSRQRWVPGGGEARRSYLLAYER